MQPNLDLRIKTMIKAMTEVVLPAVDPANKAAVEQASLVVGSLGLIMSQVNYLHWYEVADINSHCSLLEKLLQLANFPRSIPAWKYIEESRNLIGRWDIPISTLQNQGRLLRDSICDIIETISIRGDVILSSKVNEIVLTHSHEQITSERAFVAKTNFDVYPESLIDIEKSLILLQKSTAA